MTKSRFTKTGFCFMLLACTCVHVNAQLDSLLSINQSERDTLWVDNVTEASWEVMYSHPREVMSALNLTETFVKSKNLFQKLPRLYLNIGIAYDVLDIPDSAMLLYNQAKELAIQLNDSSILASAFNNIGLVHWNSNQLDSALHYYIQSEAIFEVIGNERGLTSTMNNIGLIYLDQERNKEARDYFRKVLAQSKIQESKYFESVAYQNIGITYSFHKRHNPLGNIDSAIFYTQQAIELQKKIQNDYGLAKSYHSISEFYNDKGLNEASIEYCLLAIETNKKIENFHALASNYYQLTWFHLILDRLQKAKNAIDQASFYIGDFEDDDLKQKIYETQVQVFLRIENPNLYQAFKKAIGMKDSLYNASINGDIIEMQEAYEAEKREKEIVLKDAAIQLNMAQIKTQIIVGIISAVFLLTIIIWLVSRFRYRQKISALEYQSKMHTEKSRISKDLHDNVGAQLTSIATRIAMANSQSASNSKAAKQLQQVGDEARETVNLLRDTIWAMNQESFTMEAFLSRTQSYATQQLRDIMEVTVEKTEKSFPELNSHTALNLFRIIQEAIQNTIKHSEADKMKFNFDQQNGNSILTISDNGKGTTLGLEDENTHYGLENMKFRAAEINAKIDFESQENCGFTIHISW